MKRHMDNHAEPEKYTRHLTPVFLTGWETTIAGELVAICNDTELPKRFRGNLKNELIEIREETEREIIKEGTIYDRHPEN